MVTRGGQYWQVVFGMAVAMILIPSTKPQGEWVWSQQVSWSCDLTTSACGWHAVTWC